ncbi:alpha/beta hydrolase [Cohnella hashimotonis]|uniref:Alpha/beta hydrolase-fold protein n=1 Tax=Cohnella hashimotonis TaxID=2826895 RepID=A0ABT6TEA7_9BACL|nr:alpha/beta hydrolase-fold protein [Cohnella hashimotonis]MDI4645171.1 alpha/beta hydrolase-fold protein [Cohnella hashimotonis]
MAILRYNFRSEILGINTNITVCYPAGLLTTGLGYRHPVFKDNKLAYEPGMKFQTVYVLHGGGEDDTIPYRYTRLEQYAEKNMAMLVSPSVNDSLYMNTTYGFKYFDYVTQELPVVVQSLFASAFGRENNFVVGMAMGGNGALALGLMRPDLYEAVVDLSGGIGVTLDREEYIRSLHWHFPKVRETLLGEREFVESEHDLRGFAEKNISDGVKVPKIFIGVGAEDFIRDRVHEDYAILKNLGYDVYYEEAEGMKHDFDMWDFYLNKALSDWLPLKRMPIYPR